MSYIPTNWKTGDIVTSEKLNHIEDGINNIQEAVSMMEFGGGSSGALIIGFDPEAEVATFNKTWQEIYDAMSAGIPCYIQKNVSFGPGVFINRSYVEYVGSNMTDYTVTAIAFVNGQVSIFAYGTSSPNGYPVSKDN